MKYRTKEGEDREIQQNPAAVEEAERPQVIQVEEELTPKEETPKKKKKKGVLNIVLAILAILLAVASVSVYLAPQLLFKVYSDEEEFQDHADQRFRQLHILPEKGSRVVTYDYGEDIAVALRFDPSDDEKLAVFRDQRIREAEEDFRTRARDEEKARKAKEGKKLLYRPLQHVLFIDTAVYESGTGARSLAIYTEEYAEKDREMVKVASDVDTWLFDGEELKKLNPAQVFMPDYKEKASGYIKKYLQENYSEDQFSPEGEKSLEVATENYNKYILDDEGMTFFFNDGEVLKEGEGVVSVDVGRKLMGESIRDSVVERFIDPNKPMVALTYDDGPGGDAERKILKCLKKYDAVATFFYLGNRVKGGSDNLKLAYSLGCEIGNHSWDHANLASLDEDQIKSQITKTNKAVDKVIGRKPTVFRPPYGSTSDKVRESANMPEILWTVDTLDWSSRDAKKIYKKVVKTKNLDGKIILMHSLYDESAEATEKLVPWLEKKGYQMVTVSELIKYKSGEAPKAGESYRGEVDEEEAETE